MNANLQWLGSLAIVLLAYGSTLGGTTWNVDFQGNSDHLGLFGQTNPIDHIEHGVFWNKLEVQAFNSTSNTEFESNTSLSLLDENGIDNGVVLSFTGDLVGWAGSSGADSLVGDYLILASFAGVDTSSLVWTLSGLVEDARYDLTFYAHNDRNPVRGIRFALKGGIAFTQTNVDAPITARVSADANGSITGTAVNLFEPDAEGDWAGLQIELVPEPSSATLALVGLLWLVRKRRRWLDVNLSKTAAGVAFGTKRDLRH